MKALIVIMGLLLTGCTFGLNPMGYVEQNIDLDTAWAKMEEFRYIAEKGDYWKSPAEFERDGGGDCEDFSAYLMYMLGRESTMILIDTGNGLHAIVEYRGIYIEPQIYSMDYEKESLRIVGTRSYRDIMLYTTLGGVKSIK